MKDTKRELQLYSEGKLNIEMNEYIASLKAVTVVNDRRSNLRGTQMGVDKVSIKTIKQLPSRFRRGRCSKVGAYSARCKLL